MPVPKNELDPRSTVFGEALAELGGAVIDASADMFVKDDAVRYHQYLKGRSIRPIHHMVLQHRNNPPLVTIFRYSTTAGMA